MVTCLNKLGIDVACYGNHEFDLQSNRTLSLAESCNFPWLLGNIKYKGTWGWKALSGERVAWGQNRLFWSSR